MASLVPPDWNCPGLVENIALYYLCHYFSSYNHLPHQQLVVLKHVIKCSLIQGTDTVQFYLNISSLIESSNTSCR